MRQVRVPLLIAMSVGLAAAWWLASAAHRSSGKAPPVTAAAAALPLYGGLPAMRLVDQDGTPFTLDRMKGRVWIANFIFTSCPMACPLMSQRMAIVQAKLQSAPPGIQLASFSIDPTTDTPPVLKKYGVRYHQDPARWTFVTGNSDAVLSVVSNGFKAALESGARSVDAKSSFIVMHGERFVLIDRDGRIRGYYRKDDAELARLLGDARRLSQDST